MGLVINKNYFYVDLNMSFNSYEFFKIDSLYYLIPMRAGNQQT